MTRNDIRIQFNKEKDLPVLTTDGTGYIHYNDDYVHWLEEIALKQVSGADTRTEPALPIQNVSVSFLSEGMANKIYKQIGLLAEKQGGITGITILNQLPSWLQNFMKELAADYGRQIDFLKSVLANER